MSYKYEFGKRTPHFIQQTSSESESDDDDVEVEDDEESWSSLSVVLPSSQSVVGIGNGSGGVRSSGLLLRCAIMFKSSQNGFLFSVLHPWVVLNDLW